MDPHILELPRKIIVGNDILEKIRDIYDDINIIGRPVILTGQTTKTIAGNAIFEILKDKSPYIFLMNDIKKEKFDKIAEEARDTNVVISVGGGRIIDSGKYLSSMMNVPLATVPTSPSHDGIASERATLEFGRSKFYSSRIDPPIAILFDINILKNAPYRLIASGCADVIANMTSVWDWKLAEKAGQCVHYSAYAAQLAVLASEFVMNSVNLIKEREERGIRNLIQALISSGISMSLAGTSAPASGAEHQFSHALDKMGSKALHGEQCGVGAIMMAYLQNQDWEKIANSLKVLEAPTNIKELGISEDLLIKALLEAPKIRERYTILSEKPLDENKARELALKTNILV